jgi:hypothetical protein
MGREVNPRLDLIVLGLVCLVAPWLAKMSGYETPRKPFDLVGIAGIFFLLGTSLSTVVVDHVTWLKVLGSFILGLPYAVGVLLLTLGALWGTMEVLREPGHTLGKHTI